MTPPLLDIQNLSVSFRTDDRTIQAVDDVSFQIHPGEIVGLVGESGSGKTVTGMSVLRLVPRPPGRFDGGRILFRDQDLLTLPVEQLRAIRGKDIGVIFQEPMTALSPLHPVGKQLCETLQLHTPDLPTREARAISRDWLERVGIPDAAERMDAYPFQFSGGMRQRVMIAMAMMLEPALIIADEPTTALDVTLQAQIFDLLLDMKGRNTSILFITHDMGVIWELSDRVVVMNDARVVEEGPVDTLFGTPRDPYTRKLLHAVPRLTDPPRARNPEPTPEPLVEIDRLKTWFPVKKGVLARTIGHIKAVDDVSLTIRAGETFGLVGESGSGKTTLGRCILGLDPIYDGSVTFKGTRVADLPRRERIPFRRHLQMIFQDPFSSLNPRSTVLTILTEGLARHGLLEASRKDTAAHWLEEVELEPDHMFRYPHEFSGGQRQRICVARAVAMRPDFIVCDEAVSALDVTIQAQVIDLLQQLQERHGLTYLFISHDLSVVKRVADRVAVMRLGRIVEHGTPTRVIENPADPYTRRLIDAVPIPGGPRRRSQAQ